MSSPDHLYSQRLHLRPLCAADEATYVSLFTMPDIMAHVGPALGRDAAASAFGRSLAMMCAPEPEAWLWIARYRDGAQDVGLFGLIKREGLPEIGAMVMEGYQGQGLAFEALSRVRDYGFTHLNLEAQFGRQLASNRRSIGLMLKLGFDQAPDGPRHIRWELGRESWAGRASPRVPDAVA